MLLSNHIEGLDNGRRIPGNSRGRFGCRLHPPLPQWTPDSRRLQELRRHPHDGDYRLCFDNSFSTRSEKMVFFEVIVDSQGDRGREDEAWGEVDATDSLAEYKMEDIRSTMDFVHRCLERSRHFQNLLRTMEARDRYLLEDNLWRVSFWSCLNLLVMLAVASTQIYTLRRLFDDKKRTFT
ncbi:transmembrane emp24 domain-containing protein 5-like isoform X2 [Gadus chalcogrammus]|uniref:transmembrane emp24 domain-containing protein 5-like isoform X2 n=1 Tax=Gadus chalcogrammus TaxID=1042646 RepID=UPI0024C2B826|nr:transmembrane emp24 domain-containing protein 5-like isoform X2 [Gadus chalcogrammus]